MASKTQSALVDGAGQMMRAGVRRLSTSGGGALANVRSMLQQLPEAADAHALVQQGSYAKALPLMRRVAEIFASLPDKSYHVVGQTEMADVMQKMGLWTQEESTRNDVLRFASEYHVTTSFICNTLPTHGISLVQRSCGWSSLALPISCSLNCRQFKT
jgi:hypothetical protein